MAFTAAVWLIPLLAVAWTPASTGAPMPDLSPPPPRPPRPPPPPPLPPPRPSAWVNVCVRLRLVPPSPDLAQPYRFDAEICAHIQSMVSKEMNPYNRIGAPTFFPDPRFCTSTTITTCGVFSSATEAQSAESMTKFAAAGWAANALLNCTAATKGYVVYVDAFGGMDFTVFGSYCNYGVRFPFCNCSHGQPDYIMPFYVNDVVLEEPGRTSKTTAYCFVIGVYPEDWWHGDAYWELECGEGLGKAEFWVDDNKRRNVTGIRLTTGDGVTSWLSPTWGAKGKNTLKATPINWYYEGAEGAKICIEVHKGITLTDMCVGVKEPNRCYASLFNMGNKDCCPTFISKSVELAP